MKRSWLVGIAAAIVLLGIAAAIAFANRAAIRSFYDTISGQDYTGDGVCCVTVVIDKGDAGDAIANKLQVAGAIKSASVFYRLVLAENPVFYPGTYSVNKSASSGFVLEQLLSEENLIVTRVTIKEGLRLGQTLKVLSASTGLPISEFEAAASDLDALGIPSVAVNADGYLFPATYEFDPNESASQILQTMVRRTFQELDNFDVPIADRHRVLTFASIVQKEARLTEDFFKVARVFQNRLDIGMMLQSDATVSYGSGGTTVTTTDEERAAKNGYNTYVRSGLPIGPIAGAGALAIDAVLHPADGDWLFFCAVNLKTGETVFSVTGAEHARAVEQWQAWMRANPGWNGD